MCCTMELPNMKIFAVIWPLLLLVCGLTEAHHHYGHKTMGYPGTYATNANGYQSQIANNYHSNHVPSFVQDVAYQLTNNQASNGYYGNSQPSSYSTNAVANQGYGNQAYSYGNQIYATGSHGYSSQVTPTYNNEVYGVQNTGYYGNSVSQYSGQQQQYPSQQQLQQQQQQQGYLMQQQPQYSAQQQQQIMYSTQQQQPVQYAVQQGAQTTSGQQQQQQPTAYGIQLYPQQDVTTLQHQVQPIQPPQQQQQVQPIQPPQQQQQQQSYDPQTTEFLSQIQSLYQPTLSSSAAVQESVYFVMPNNMIAKYPNAIVVAKGEPQPGYSIVKWSPETQRASMKKKKKKRIQKKKKKKYNSVSKRDAKKYVDQYQYDYGDYSDYSKKDLGDYGDYGQKDLGDYSDYGQKVKTKVTKNDYYDYAYDGSAYNYLDSQKSQATDYYDYDYQAPQPPKVYRSERKRNQVSRSKNRATYGRRRLRMAPARKRFMSHRNMYVRQRYHVPMYMRFAKTFGRQPLRRSSRNRFRNNNRRVQKRRGNDYTNYESPEEDYGNEEGDYGNPGHGTGGGKNGNVKYVVKYVYGDEDLDESDYN